jgi:outer membrane receptor protein involved in Fe transport
MWVADLPIFSIGAHSIDGQVQLDWQLGDNLLLICGGNLRYNTLDWENINVSEEDELRAAVFAHLQWMPLDEVQLTGGVRLDANTFTETAISPRAAAVFRPFGDHAFRLGYGLAFRRPSSFESRTHTTIERFNPAVPEIVELADTQFGNESLVNEKVHSFEAGWRGRFFDDNLRVSLDFFFSLYRDTITFVMDVPTRLGLPDLTNATIRYENEGAEVNAFGGEAELIFRPVENWSFWCSLGMREITNKGEDTPSEPRLRINLGGRFAPPAGLLMDVALHYVSAYEMPLMDPSNILGNPALVPLGDDILMIARVGYRITPGVEAGVTVLAPLGKPFREYAGAPMPASQRVDSASDFGGEILTRLVSLYLRGSF